MDLYNGAVDVAISDLRANLKSFVERARQGEQIVVTDRGVPVARLGPAEEESLLDRLERDGLVTHAEAKPRPRARKGRGVPAKGSVAEVLHEHRQDRADRVLG